MGLSPSLDFVFASALEGAKNVFFSRALVEFAHASFSSLDRVNNNVAGSLC